MLKTHSQPDINNNKIKFNINDENEMQNNQLKKRKLINYTDYLKLKEAYISYQEKNKKTKEENDKLNNLLSSYQQEISKFNDFKKNIYNSFEIMQKKLNELFQENKLLNFTNNENTKKFNDIINELNSEIRQYQLELSEKSIEIQKLKNIIEENNKNKNEDFLYIKENEIKEKENFIINKEMEIQNKEKNLNNKEMKIKEKENLLKLEENELKKEMKRNEEIYQKLNEEINMKEKKIIIENNKINENKISINETIEKLKIKELHLNNELTKIKSFKENWKNFILKREIKIEYKQIKKHKIKYLIESKDKFEIIRKENIKNIEINFNSKEPQIYTFNNNNKNTKLSKINHVLMDNYLNTIKIGYNESNDIISGSLEEIDFLDNECEPIPSFLLCLQKEKE